ncbi:MAG: ATP-dependent helicase [Elusimicrobia bacterium]|nr:ATP-dependent helicase [Elusimicrobiota bacterium]
MKDSKTLTQEQTTFRLTDPVSQIMEGLNPSQKEAVLHGEGPLLIVAGAGTGKTTVITKKIAYLISAKKAKPSEILALTFTDKAANEMEERVDQLIPYGFNDVSISTFHSFGDKILREYAFEIGLSPSLRVLTLPEAVVFMRQHLFELKLNYYRPLTDPTHFVESLLTAFSRSKDEDISPKELEKIAKEKVESAKGSDEKEDAKKMMEVAHAYQSYENLKLLHGFIDFGDQVLFPLKILKEHPSILKKMCGKFKVILVDEFQDTNYAQFSLLKLLSQNHRNITVVGDDDQAIYKFRGACLSNILSFRKDFPEAKEIVLQDNYRSTQEILDSSYKLIQHNNPYRLEYCDHISKALRSIQGFGLEVRSLHFENLFAETDFITGEIKKRIASLNNEPKDFAILVRTNANAEPFMKSLKSEEIPWRFSGNAGLYDQEEIRVALAFLRVLDQPDDSSSLYYLASSSLYEIESEDLAALTQLSTRSHKSLYDIFKNKEDYEKQGLIKINVETKNKIEKILEELKKFRALSFKIPTGYVLYQYFELNGIFKKLAESKDDRSLQQAQNFHKFFELIKRFAQVAQYDRVHYFIEYLEALRIAGEDPESSQADPDENAVNLLTVHAAKGLEFPVVFLVGLEQGHFPLNDRGEAIEIPESLIKDILPQGDVHIQEERRLAYVGMTRAKEELILCSARDMGKKKLWKPSQFILEALDKPQIDEKVLKTNPLDSLKIFSSEIKENKIFKPEEKQSKMALKTSLTVTSIEDYLKCPLKYKFSQILKIPVLIHHTAVFGMAIHEALKGFHLARRDLKKMSIETVLELFKSAWQSIGFISREHEEKRFKEGIKILKSYYKKEEKSQKLPFFVEQDFKMRVDENTIRGRWDRIDKDQDGITIIDYKTGDVKDQKEADQKANASIQLLLYAASFKAQFGELPSKTILNFVKREIVGTAVPKAEKIEKVLETTKKVIQGIKEERFNPAPGYHCHWCAFEKICPAIAKKI